MEVCVLIPVFNDWDSLDMLLGRLATALSHRPLDAFRVLIIDDGSTVYAVGGSSSMTRHGASAAPSWSRVSP